MRTGVQRQAACEGPDDRAWQARWGREWALEWEALLEGLWPSACAVCGAWAADHVACARHPLALDGAVARCGLCSRALPTGVVVERADPEPPWRTSGVRARRASWRRCRECRMQAPGYGRLLCLGDYGVALRPWVLALKHGRRTVALPLARLLAERLRAADWHTARAAGVAVVLVPVPSHRWRRFERGADGPRALAEALGREMGWPVCDLLERVRFTTPQGDPGSVSRTDNVSGALRVSRSALAGLAWRQSMVAWNTRHLARWTHDAWRWILARLRKGADARIDEVRTGASAPKDRRWAVLLVDDVVTSGATLAEATRALRKCATVRGKAQHSLVSRWTLPRHAPYIGAISVARAQWGRAHP